MPADGAAYLTGLTAIDPALTANEDRAIRRAENICADITAGKVGQTVIGNTVQLARKYCSSWWRGSEAGCQSVVWFMVNNRRARQCRPAIGSS